VRVDILLTYEKLFHNSIMSLRGEVLGSYQASITPPTLIEVPVPRLENERSSTTNVRYINFASFYEFQLDIRAVPTICYFLSVIQNKTIT
jgi:hypothetical protein